MQYDPASEDGVGGAAHDEAALSRLFGQREVGYADSWVEAEWSGERFRGADQGQGGAGDEGAVDIDARRAREECVL